MTRPGVSVEQLAHELSDLFVRTAGYDINDMPEGLDTELRAVEIDSLLFVNFLVSVEERYPCEWGPDTPPEALSTMKTIAKSIVAQMG